MSVLVGRDELLTGIAPGMDIRKDAIIDDDIAWNMSNGVYPPIFHRYRSKGIFVISIYKKYTWVYVIIDERLPVDLKTRKPVFGHCQNLEETWVALIEKAYAKMHGCYENLISGYIDQGIQEFTGFQPEKVIIRNEKTGVFPSLMVKKHYGGEEGFWNFLIDRKQDNCLMGCSIKGNGKEGPLIIEGVPTGLIMNHAYGLNDIFELEDRYDKTIPIRLLRLRNPWGKSEWVGAWGSDSEEMKKYKKDIQEQYINKLEPEEQFDIDADDGTFLMHYDDWKDTFSNLFINNDFPDEWTGVRFKSAWTSSNAMGLPKTYTPDELERYAQNPQFLVKPVEDCEVVASLGQEGGRLPVDGKYFDYPFAETLDYNCLAVFQLDFGETYLRQFDRHKLKYISPIKREVENSGRFQLEGGQSYILVASNELPGVNGVFHLSLYIDKKFRDLELKRVFHPNDRNLAKDEHLPIFIPEEEEKVLPAPTWKLELVRESLKYIIADEDVVVSSDSNQDH